MEGSEAGPGVCTSCTCLPSHSLVSPPLSRLPAASLLSALLLNCLLPAPHPQWFLTIHRIQFLAWPSRRCLNRPKAPDSCCFPAPFPHSSTSARHSHPLFPHFMLLSLRCHCSLSQEQLVCNGKSFPPWGIFGDYADTFVRPGGHHWHLVIRGQGCCYMSDSTHEKAHLTKDHLCRNVNSATAEKPWPKV